MSRTQYRVSLSVVRDALTAPLVTDPQHRERWMPAEDKPAEIGLTERVFDAYNRVDVAAMWLLLADGVL